MPVITCSNKETYFPSERFTFSDVKENNAPYNYLIELRLFQLLQLKIYQKLIFKNIVVCNQN